MRSRGRSFTSGRSRRTRSRGGDRVPHRSELLPQRRLRIRDLAARQARDPAGVHARPDAPPRSSSGLGSSWASRSEFSAIVVPRWGHRWFTLSLGIVIAVMMLTYVTVPARIVGISPPVPAGTSWRPADRRHVGAIICTPPTDRADRDPAARIARPVRVSRGRPARRSDSRCRRARPAR